MIRTTASLMCLGLVAIAATIPPAVHHAAQDREVSALAARVDPYTRKQRVIVMTDIANEPDDQMSMIRFLVYAKHFDVEGLNATTSTWMKNTVRPDVIHTLVDAYEQVSPKLAQHESGFPAAESLRTSIAAGQPAYGMAAVGAGKMSAGADAIVRAADRPDPRPLWVFAWGGANTLAPWSLPGSETRSNSSHRRTNRAS